MSFVSILAKPPNRVCGLGKLAHGYESRPDRNTLPIAVVFRFLFLNARGLADDPAGIQPYSTCTRVDTPREMFTQLAGAERIAALGALAEHLRPRRVNLTRPQPTSALAKQYFIGNRRDVETVSPTDHGFALHARF